jgi:hypothetical protein
MTEFIMPETTQQEQFSIAYVHSIASAAGYGIEEIRVDVDSIDLSIVQYGQGDENPEIDTLRAQLKCTYKFKPKEDGLHFQLKKKNYDDLRRKCIFPRVLIVLYVPDNVEKWLQHSDSNLSLYHCAYWLSLREMPSRDTDSVMVTLTKKFTIDELKRIMNLLAQGRQP